MSIIAIAISVASCLCAIETIRNARYTGRIYDAMEREDWDELHRVMARAPKFGFRHEDHNRKDAK